MYDEYDGYEEEYPDDETLYSQRSHWDEKEIERRKEIAGRFEDIGFANDIDILNNIVDNAEYREVAFAQRVALNTDDYKLFIRTLRDINQHLAMSQAVLDSYITFSNSTPKFKNLLNILFHFHQFITDQESSIFYNARLEKEGVHYFLSKEFKKYSGDVCFLLNRITGVLRVASWYIVDSESASQENHSQGYGGYGGGYGGGGYNGMRDYAYPQARGYEGDVKVTKMNVQRDIGDTGDA